MGDFNISIVDFITYNLKLHLMIFSYGISLFIKPSFDLSMTLYHVIIKIDPLPQGLNSHISFSTEAILGDVVSYHRMSLLWRSSIPWTRFFFKQGECDQSHLASYYRWAWVQKEISSPIHQYHFKWCENWVLDWITVFEPNVGEEEEVSGAIVIWAQVETI